MSTVEGSQGEARLQLEFCGEWTAIDPDEGLMIGRDADLTIDDNPYLHRRFLEVRWHDGTWWLVNVGNQLAATLSDAEGRVQAWLAPGAHIPIVFETNIVRFGAGPTSYEFSLHLDQPAFSATMSEDTLDGSTTLGRVSFTEEQRLLVLALAEPALRNPGAGSISLPVSTEAAARLGWAITKFNRKLDSVCQKLEKAGVRGLHGDESRLASARRARLVEYALALRIVTADDLALLDRPHPPSVD